MNSCFLVYIYYRNLKPGANLTIDPSMQQGSSDHATSSGSQGDSKLELFGFDSLVNILGLKRYDSSFYNFI
jgi:potassium/chloride transporter 4/5/6